MFTGIISETGVVRGLLPGGGGARIAVACKGTAAALTPGDSVAVDGVCLTAVRTGPGFFEADISPETVSRSTLGAVAAGDGVNLELPVTATTPLGGHIVQGHVDGVGVVVALKPEGRGYRLRVRYPQELGVYLVEKGSVAVAGISFTVAGLDDETFEVAVVPYSAERTTVASWRPGRRVNLEADIIAKYVAKLWGQTGGGVRINAQRLAALGFEAGWKDTSYE